MVIIDLTFVQVSNSTYFNIHREIQSFVPAVGEIPAKFWPRVAEFPTKICPRVCEILVLSGAPKWKVPGVGWGEGGGGGGGAYIQMTSA